MDDIAKIAATLTARQRDALETAYPTHQDSAQGLQVKTPRIWKALIDKGLGYPKGPRFPYRGKDDRCVLNKTGLAVRDYLRSKTDG